MRRLLATLVVVAFAACSKSDSTGPSAVASVVITAPLPTINVGQTTTLTAAALDASGGTLTGKTVTWTSSNPAVATVVGGLVTGISAGQATITAVIEAKNNTTVITVVAAAANCGAVTPLSVGIGEVHTLTATERSQLCLSSGTSGGEYVLIPFNTGVTSNTGTPAATFSLSIAATNTVAATGAPTTASATLSMIASPASNALQAAFQRRLQASIASELSPALRNRSRLRALLPQRSITAPPEGISAIVGLPATPAIGTPVRLNTTESPSCSGAVVHGGRVAAVSTQAIVVVDSGAPAGGFTDAEYQSIAVTFDTLIYPLDTTAFGKPFDLDNNGRVLIFFTQTVNQLTPATSTTGVIGGFFHPRDLFPITANTQVPVGCAGSNVGEMFYMPVVDANSQFNPFFKDKTRITTSTISTLAHEFQHLINGSRRVYVTTADVDFMETWLNEAMSHVAEELLYYRISGLTAKSDLTLATVTSTQQRFDAINGYQIDNLNRLISYLKAPDSNSPYSTNDVLATRGASWELLRYSLDLSSTPTNTLLHQMVDSPISVPNPVAPETNGMAIYNSIFGASIPGGLTAAVRQQAIAQFFDNSGVAIASQYAFPSWNYRNVIPGIKDQSGVSVFTYPQLTRTLVPGAPATFSLVGGGTGYARFRVNANVVAGITPTTAGGAVPAAVELILIRTQ